MHILMNPGDLILISKRYVFETKEGWIEFGPDDVFLIVSAKRDNYAKCTEFTILFDGSLRHFKHHDPYRADIFIRLSI